MSGYPLFVYHMHVPGKPHLQHVGTATDPAVRVREHNQPQRKSTGTGAVVSTNLSSFRKRATQGGGGWELRFALGPFRKGCTELALFLDRHTKQVVQTASAGSRRKLVVPPLDALVLAVCVVWCLGPEARGALSFFAAYPDREKQQALEVMRDRVRSRVHMETASRYAHSVRCALVKPGAMINKES